jgi:hypothetical protein
MAPAEAILGGVPAGSDAKAYLETYTLKGYSLPDPDSASDR